MRSERSLSHRALAATIMAASLGMASLVAAQESGDPPPTDRWLAAHQKPNPTQYFGEPINLSLRNADLVEVLRSFAEIGDFNLVLQPGISGTVTVELKDVPWDQALTMILKINNLGMDISGGKVRVGNHATARSAWGKMITVELPLQYADSSVVARALKEVEGLPSPGGAIRAEAEGNRLILRDRRQVLSDYGRVLSYVDVPSAADESPASLASRCGALWRKLVVVGSSSLDS